MAPDTNGWIRVAARASAAGLRDRVSAAMFEGGALGIHEERDWLVTHVESPAECDAIVRAVRRVDRGAEVETRAIPAVDWSVAWRETIVTHVAGNLTVAPPWLADGLDPAHAIIVDPAMAFGTGDHPTTRGVLRLMQGVIRAGDRVADLGAGSAVLAIAAAKLGAARVVAIELDHEAISNAEENVGRNGVAGTVSVIEGDAALLLPLVAPVRVIFANIISSVLRELLPVMHRSLAGDGVAILSGILGQERAAMLELFGAESGWRVIAEDTEGEWWSVAIAVARN